MNAWPASDATTDDLRAALDNGLAECAPGRRVRALERSPLAQASSAAIEELRVELDDGARLDVIFKDGSDAALSDAARLTRRPWARDPAREAGVYRVLLPEAALGTARCYAAVTDARLGRYWLFLERAPGVELYQIGDIAVWQEVAGSLARMHRALEPGGPVRCGVPLIRYDGAWYRRWLRRARATSRLADGYTRDVLEQLVDAYRRVADTLAELPARFVHGELYASNVLFDERTRRVCVVDWETAGIGAPLLDLAALAAGGWSDPDRRAIVDAYRDASPEARALGDDELAHQLDCCRLHQAVQWIARSRRWSPPPQHAYDWWNEALRTAERVGR